MLADQVRTNLTHTKFIVCIASEGPKMVKSEKNMLKFKQSEVVCAACNLVKTCFPSSFTLEKMPSLQIQ